MELGPFKHEESGAYALGEAMFYVVLLVAGILFLLYGRQDKKADGRGDGTGKVVTGWVLLSVFVIGVVGQIALSLAPEDPAVAAAQRSADRRAAEQEDIAVQVNTARQFLVRDPELRARSTAADGIVVDLRYAAGGATGTVRIGKDTGDIRFVDELIYYRPSPGLWKKLAATPTDAESIIRLTDGRWVDLDKRDTFYRNFKPLADTRWLLDGIPAGTRPRLGKPEQVRGKECVVLLGALGSKLYLERTTSKPVRIVARDKEVTDIWFEAKAPRPQKPGNVVDSSEILDQEDDA